MGQVGSVRHQRRAPGRRHDPRPRRQRWRGRQANARHRPAGVARPRPVPDAGRIRLRQGRRLYRRLPRPSASRVRDRDLHAQQAHTPWRQPGQCRPAASRLGAVDDRRPRHHPFRDAGAGGRADEASALGQPAGQGQDDQAALPGHRPGERPGGRACGRHQGEGAGRQLRRGQRPGHQRRDRSRSISTSRCRPG